MGWIFVETLFHFRSLVAGVLFPQIPLLWLYYFPTSFHLQFCLLIMFCK